MNREKDAYNELCSYTLTRGDSRFIHQHVVDAWSAQHADGESKPIGVAFALIGLCLLIERNWSGRQVQHAHIQLARRRHSWPTFALPRDRGSITAIEVMAAREGSERDSAIHAWCASVWAAYADCHREVAALLGEHGIS